jgi:hypothetical protein
MQEFRDDDIRVRCVASDSVNTRFGVVTDGSLAVCGFDRGDVSHGWLSTG